MCSWVSFYPEIVDDFDCDSWNIAEKHHRTTVGAQNTEVYTQAV